MIGTVKTPTVLQMTVSINASAKLPPDDTASAAPLEIVHWFKQVSSIVIVMTCSKSSKDSAVFWKKSTASAKLSPDNTASAALLKTVQWCIMWFKKVGAIVMICSTSSNGSAVIWESLKPSTKLPPNDTASALPLETHSDSKKSDE